MVHLELTAHLVDFIQHLVGLLVERLDLRTLVRKGHTLLNPVAEILGGERNERLLDTLAVCGFRVVARLPLADVVVEEVVQQRSRELGVVEPLVGFLPEGTIAPHLVAGLNEAEPPLVVRGHNRHGVIGRECEAGEVLDIEAIFILLLNVHLLAGHNILQGVLVSLPVFVGRLLEFEEQVFHHHAVEV